MKAYYPLSQYLLIELIFAVNMKKIILLSLLCVVLMFVFLTASPQCSVCSKTASQLGPKAASGLNTGIIYLMITPFLISGYIGYRWWKNNRDTD